MGKESYNEFIQLIIENEPELNADAKESYKLDAPLFTGICAYVERFLHAKAS